MSDGTPALAFERQRAAMAVTGVTGPEKAVLLVLAIMANAEGQAWPSITQIAARTSIGRRTAFRAVDALVDRGLVGQAVTPGKGTLYTLRLDWCPSGTSAGAAPVPERHSTGAGAAPKQPRTANEDIEDARAPLTGARAAVGDSAAGEPRTGARRGKAGAAGDSGRPPRRPRSTALSEAPGVDILPLDLPASVTADQWRGFVDMRREIGKPLTGRALTLALNMLNRVDADGGDPGAILDQSTFHKWAGLFPLRETRDGDGHGAGRRRAAEPQSPMVRALLARERRGAAASARRPPD